jgi:ribosomal protein S18 acetylase RimI-like enzyme
MQTRRMHGRSRQQLPGEETLFGSWAALAAESAGARMLSTGTSFAAVFPEWEVLNNAILLDPPTTETASTAARELADVYSHAGVRAWALWVPSHRRDLDASDTVAMVDGMVRDTTTLVMTLDLSDGMPSHPGVLATTVETAGLAGGTPVPGSAVPVDDRTRDINGWVFIEDELAVAGAWTYRKGRDVGVYAVGTAPEWRRRGHARALMVHALADAYRHGARTASLQATAMGASLYRSLGFRPVGRYEEWIATIRREDQPCVSC